MPSFDSLEPRLLLAAALPTNDDQYLLELINRARANPSAEAARYGIALNEGVSSGNTISTDAKQPLAFNLFLIDAAQKHSQWMLDTDTFSHTGQGGSSPQSRMTSAGYNFNPPGFTAAGSGENIAWHGTTGALGSGAAGTHTIHENLFVDEGYPGRGHRVNILNPSFKELGTGVKTGTFAVSGTTYNAFMGSEDFAYVNPGVFLTGVAYADTITADSFYTPGEGLGGITITATNNANPSLIYTTTTFSTGGYTLSLPGGTYTTTASGGSVRTPLTFNAVSIGSTNVKRDFVPSTPIPDTAAPGGFGTGKKVLSAGGTFQKFTVTWSDFRGLQASSIGHSDVAVVSPDGTKTTARMVSKDTSSNLNTIVATYRIVPPGGSWDAGDNGTYKITVRPGQVSDRAGNFAPIGAIGKFKVIIPTPGPLAPAAPAPIPPLFSNAPISDNLFSGESPLL